MKHTSNENIAEALELLEEAAKQKKNDLMTLMSDKYTSLKSTIMEKEGTLMKSLITAKDHAVEVAAHAKDVGVEKVREVASDVDKSVHQNPWAYIAGTAGVGLLVGFALGRSRKKN